MIYLSSTTELLLSDLSIKAVEDLVAGDKLFMFDPSTETQQLATVSSITTPVATSFRVVNDELIHSSSGLVVYRNEAYQVRNGYYSHDTVPFIEFDDTLRTVDSITSDEAYTFGATLSTLYGNWSKANLYAYLAGVFDKAGELKISSTGISGISFSGLSSSSCYDYVEELVGILHGNNARFPEVSQLEAVALYEGMEPYLEVFSFSAETAGRVAYPISMKNATTGFLIGVETDVSGGALLLANGHAIGAM